MNPAVFRRLRRGVLLPLIALAALAALLAPSLASATPTATTGDITGTVSEGGTLTGDLTVYAYPVGTNPFADIRDNNAAGAAASYYTTSNGAFDLTGLAPGNYTVIALPAAGDGDVPTFSTGATTYSGAAGSPVAVTANATTANTNIAMVTGGTVTGTITNSSSAGVPAATVNLATAGGQVAQALVSSTGATFHYVALSATTASSGTVGSYSITGVPAGSYFADILGSTATSGNNADEWYGGKPTQNGATSFGVANGASSTVNQSLSSASEITGTVDNGSSAFTGGGSVAAYTSDGGLVGSSTISTTTGAYTIRGLLAGTYYLEVSPTNTSSTTFADAWYAGSSLAESLPTSTPITVGASQGVTATTFSVLSGGTVSGTVTSGGAGAADITATLYDSSGNPITSVGTASDGTYAFGNARGGAGDAGTFLLPGRYKVGFSAGNGANLGFQYYDNTTTLAGASAVTVSGSGANTPSIDAALTPGGSVTGTVTSAASGAALPNVTVELEDASGNVLDQTNTLANGTYTLSGVPTGSYYVEFVADNYSGASGYQTQYYSGKQVLAGSNTVSVTAPNSTGSINAAMGPLTTPAQTTYVAVPYSPQLTATIPTVTGSDKVGSRLTAHVSGWTYGTRFAYQWYAGTKAIRGATSSSYTLTANQYRQQITLLVTGELSGYTWKTVASRTSGKVAEGSLHTARPSIAGRDRVGDRLSAHTGRWSRGTRFSYQWYANRRAIRGAHARTLKLGRGERGRSITVKVTGRQRGYRNASRTSRGTHRIG